MDRAYYLWEDDKNSGREIQSEKHYYLLAIDINNKLDHDKIFQDTKDKNKYEECNICMDYKAKIECLKCKNSICARCVTKVKSCPFCRFTGLKIKRQKRFRYTREELLNLRQPVEGRIRPGGQRFGQMELEMSRRMPYNRELGIFNDDQLAEIAGLNIRTNEQHEEMLTNLTMRAGQQYEEIAVRAWLDSQDSQDN